MTALDSFSWEQTLMNNGKRLHQRPLIATLRFRVLRDVYDVKDFGPTKVKLSIPKPAPSVTEPALLPIQLPAESSAGKPYAVFVDDNFQYMREEERYKNGDYATLDEAGANARVSSTISLRVNANPGFRRRSFTIKTVCLERIHLSAVRELAFQPGLRPAAL
jgi:hypothetical protein